MSEFQKKLNYLKDIIKIILKFLLYFDYLNIEELKYKRQYGGSTNATNVANANAATNVANAGAATNVANANASVTPELTINERKDQASESAMNTSDLDDDKDLEKIETSIAGNNFFIYMYSKGKKVLVKTGAVAGDIIGLLIAKFFYAATFPTLPFFAVMGFMYSFIKYGAFKIRGL